MTNMVVRVPSRVVCLLCQHTPNRSLNPAQRRQVRKLHAQTQTHPAVEEDENPHVYNTPLRTENHVSLLPQHALQRQVGLHAPAQQPPSASPFSPQPKDTTFIISSFPISGDLMPHPAFRLALSGKLAGKDIRRVLTEQLLRCQTPRDVLRIMAVAMQRKDNAREMTRTQEALRRAIYRARNNVSDETILRTINVIILRLRMAKLPIDTDLLRLAVKFAARTRSLSGMKRYLGEFKRSGSKMSRNLFRTIIAKFSIGTRGLGEIRNGRWKRKELLQVLLGFEDTPPEDACHLAIFLQREDWHFFNGWLAVLAKCKAVDQLWDEWQYWLTCSSRTFPRKLNVTARGMTTRTRGDYWFVEQMAFAGDLEKAWTILRISGIPFAKFRKAIRDRLLEGAQHATLPSSQVRDELLEKYDIELRKIETALAIKWVSCANGDGYHVSKPNMEESLESLSSPDFVLQPDYGYPWEESTAEGKIMLRQD